MVIFFHKDVRLLKFSDVGSYLKLGGQVEMWGHNLPNLDEIGLTDLPKLGWAIAHPSPTSLIILEQV